MNTDQLTDGNVIAIIPARGGSKGIPLKNLREIGFRPLIVHTIEAARNAESIDRVVVSTDSERIAKVAEQAGAEVPFIRPAHLSDDKTPLAAVMNHFVQWGNENGWNIKALVILEPTSPLRTSTHIDEAVRLFFESNADTVVSVQEDRSLGWEIDEAGLARPLQEERLNRQYMRPRFKENGAIFVTRPQVITDETTIGDNVQLYVMSDKESIDINNFWELRLSDIILRNVKILFHFKANAELGFGHYYRALTLANRLYYNDIVLVCSDYDENLEEKIATTGFRYHLTNDPLSIIRNENQSIVINDILDTSEEYMREISNHSRLIVNFEDLGPGRNMADLVFNALYDDFSIDPKHYGGAAYAIMREEFLFLERHVIREEVGLITATFGGSDPNNIAYHCMNALPKRFPDIKFRIIIGPGYKHDKKKIRKMSRNLDNVELIEGSTNMAKHLQEADIAITSGGRTVFEAAACGTPCIVICQNQRELRHRHITSRDGVINLGLFSKEFTMNKLIGVIEKLIENPSIRATMSERSSNLMDGLGLFRIIGLIEKAARMKGITRML